VKAWKLMLCSAALIAACLPAYSADPVQLKVKVPFAFTAGGQNFSAGQYTVRQMLPDSKTVWMFRSVDGEVRLVNTTAVESAAVDRNFSLVFLYSAGQYSLYELWPGGHLGRAVPQSRLMVTRVGNSHLVEIPAEK
jgi:hypothetical protein